MRLHLWQFVAAVFFNYTTQTRSDFDLEIAARVTLAMHHYYKTGCIFLLHTPGFKDSILQKEMRRRLSEDETGTSIITFQMLEFKPHVNHCRYVPPLNVIMFHNNATLRSLRELHTSLYTKVKWLLFMDSNYIIKETFEGLELPFNSEFVVAQQYDNYVNLTELFHINPEYPIQENQLGHWTSERGLDFTDIPLYERRYNLMGTTIKTGYFQDVAVKVITNNNGEPKATGYFGEVWQALQNRLNFRTKYSRSSTKAYGSLQENGNWSGLIGMITRNEVHVAVQSLTVTEERSNVVDFTLPLLRSTQCILIQRPGRNGLHWGNFIEPFSTKLWMAVICCMVGLTVFLWATYYTLRFFSEELEQANFTLPVSFAYVYTSFCQQGCITNPTSASARLVCIVIKLTATVLLGGYSAYLIAHLAVDEPDLPFSDFKSLLKDGTYKLGVLANSFMTMYFDSSASTLMPRIYEKLVKPYSLPNSWGEGIRNICKDKKYAFWALDDMVTSARKKATCRISVAWQSNRRNAIAIAIAKGSPYRDIIEHNLNKMRDSGILHRLKESLWPNPPVPWKNTYNSVQIEAVAPILLLPAIGVITSIFILVSECFIQRYNWRFHNNEMIIG
ncbi:Ionotropic receptor 116 [Blattella germanica]|nr:Ionotropic receptor 116 [Blattella germanica]